MKKLLLTLLIFSSSSHCMLDRNETEKMVRIGIYAIPVMLVGGTAGALIGAGLFGRIGYEIGGHTARKILQIIPSANYYQPTITKVGQTVGVLGAIPIGARRGWKLGMAVGGGIGAHIACDENKQIA